jgi:hypothetical protein
MANRVAAHPRLPAAAAQPSSLRRLLGSSERLLIGGGTLLLFFAAWELIARTGLVNALFISSPRGRDLG